MANETAVKMKLMTRDEATKIKLLLEKYDLPVTYKVDNVQEFYETFFLDKKSSDSAITFIIPVGLGDVKITNECEKEMILSVLSEFGDAQ
jgi:3-dehydroquinate synthase